MKDWEKKHQNGDSGLNIANALSDYEILLSPNLPIPSKWVFVLTGSIYKLSNLFIQLLNTEYNYMVIVLKYKYLYLYI